MLAIPAIPGLERHAFRLILRSAGLVTIHDDGVHGWRFARRAEGVGEVGAELAEYLGGARK